MRALRSFLTPALGPYNLAVARIVVFGLMFVLAWSSTPRAYAGLPAALRSPTTFSVMRFVPTSVPLATTAQVVLIVTAAMATIGLATRLAAPVAVGAAVYYFGLRENYGQISHIHHHLLWFGAVLAVSACADALSVDARQRGGDEPAPSIAYGLPLRCIWVLLGMVYLFPGLGKVATQGLGWASPENMRLLVRARWFVGQPDWHGALVVDTHPLVLAAMGVGAVIFELSALPLLLWRWGRRVFIAAGVAFHTATRLVLGISFWPLVISYAVLVDWDGRRGRVDPGPQPEPRLPRSVFPAAVVGAALVAAVVAAGAVQVSWAWPVSSYPSFADRFSADGMRLVVDVGREDPVDLREGFPMMDGPHFAGLAASLVRATGGEQDRKLDAAWRYVRGRPPFAPAARATIIRQDLHIGPDGRGTVFRETRLRTIGPD